jgi:hypothetical protein
MEFLLHAFSCLLWQVCDASIEAICSLQQFVYSDGEFENRSRYRTFDLARTCRMHASTCARNELGNVDQISSPDQA